MSKNTTKSTPDASSQSGLAGRSITSEFETIQSAARRLDVSTNTVHEWIRRGVLPSYRLGLRAIRLRVADVDAMLRPRPLLTGNER